MFEFRDAARLKAGVTETSGSTRRSGTEHFAEVVGADWPGRAREAVSIVMSGAGDDAESIGVRLLADIRAVFERAGDDKLPSKLLAQPSRAMVWISPISLNGQMGNRGL